MDPADAGFLYIPNKPMPEGTQQQSPGVFVWTDPHAIQADLDLGQPWTCAEDETGTLNSRDWESDEEAETPPSSPKRVDGLASKRSKWCPGCQKEFKLFKR